MIPGKCCSTTLGKVGASFSIAFVALSMGTAAKTCPCASPMPHVSIWFGSGFRPRVGHTFDAIQNGRNSLRGGETDDSVGNHISRNAPWLEFPIERLPITKLRFGATDLAAAKSRQMRRRQPPIRERGHAWREARQVG